MKMNGVPAIGDYLRYVQLQMAAEAFLFNSESGATNYQGEDLVRALVRGNDHTLRFTPTDAQAFADHWVVLDQQANTSTGFSGTLFKCIQADPLTGAKTGDLVMSLRSTEFIDDAARDNQGTNVLEISRHGFAFGQIRDMQTWYQGLVDSGKLPAGQSFAVTGYSLGAHLATVFNLLHQDEGRISQVVTFNGAGVGGVEAGTTLAQVVSDFARLSANASGHEFGFSDPQLAELYGQLRQSVNAGGSATPAQRQALTDLINAPNDGSAAVLPETRVQAQMIWEALSRIDIIRAEVARLPGLPSGDGATPRNVADVAIGQENLDYQMAVLTVGQHTGAASLVGGAIRMIGSKQYGGHLDNQFDLPRVLHCAANDRLREDAA